MNKIIGYCSVTIFVGVLFGCGTSYHSRHLIYEKSHKEKMQNTTELTIPYQIKMRPNNSHYYYIKPKKALPTPLPSLLPPNSLAIKKDKKKGKKK